MEKLNDLIDFYEMIGDEPELLVMLLELRRHRTDNWRQRAEVAEAKLAAAKGVKKIWQDRAWTAEEKLAELEKQEAIFQVEVSGNHWLNAGPVEDSDFTGLPDGINLLYARPAPAIDLAELIEASANKQADEIIHLFDGVYDDRSRAWSLANNVWDACHTAILRKIKDGSHE